VVQEAAPVKDEFLLYNPLYKAGKIAAVSCSLPTARLVNKQAMIRYATAFVACLEKAWEPVVTRAGFDIKPVSAVHSAPTGTDSVCGVMEQDVGAFYCGRDLGIYFNWPGYIVEGATQEDSRTAVQYLIAHEYGHHVQELTGILDEYDERWGAAGSTQQMVEQNRMEMQAHCFAAAMFGANQATLRIRGYRRDHYGHVGYNRNEAESVNFDRWLRQGFEAKGPAGCLTWAAPAAKVS
jgi:predicted metalloprotease